MNKRILAMLMALAMIIGMVPMNVGAEETCEHEYEIVPTSFGMHQYECQLCGDAYGAGQCKGADSNYDGTCDACGTYYKHTCNENGLKYKNPNAHNVVCTQCGKSSGAEGHSYNITKSVGASGHVLACACGHEKSTVAGHYDSNGDNYCDSCGYQMYVPPVEEHEHNYVAHSNNNGTHTSSCNCGNSVTVNCADSNGDNNCDSCGYVLYTPPVEEHEHNYVAHSNNDGTHTSSCNCGLEVKNVTCLDSDGDGKCDSCGYVLYTPPVEEHEHNYVAHSNNDGTHTSSCNCGLEVKNVTCLDNDGEGKCDSCGYVLYTPPVEEHEHNYVAHSNNDGTHTSSCNCGLEVKNVTCLDNDGDGKCDSCGYQKYTAPEGDHEHNYVAHSNNDGTHLLTCNCGLEVKNVTCLDNDGDGKCDSCGYQKYTAPEGDHEHNYVAHSNNDGTHELSCNCGKSVTVTCLDSDGDGKCDSCGYQKYTAPEGDHEHNYIAHSNNDGTHLLTCNCGKFVTFICLDPDGDGKCDSCGYQKYTAPEGEHEHNYIAHSNNNGTHLLTCNCGKSVTVTCLDPNGDGKCDSCGYQKYPTCNHEGGPWMSNDDGTHTSSCDCGKNTVTGECQFIGDSNKCYMCGYEKHVEEDKPDVDDKPVVDDKDYDDVPKTGDILSMILAFFGF